MTLARYFVARQRDVWLVTLDGRPVARHATRAEAVEDAIAMAAHMGSMQHEADVMVEPDADHPPELAWTFGKDPLPKPRVRDDGPPTHVRQVQRAAAS
ncbi:MAG TPA: hypothetical protein VGN80_11790 [Devosiaceae bacterium]|jgi:hypothetical protein|nr:hypothetical protein [Devosiaceae bacterium]